MEARNDNAEDEVCIPNEHLDLILRYWRHHYASEWPLETCRRKALPILRTLRFPEGEMLECLVLAMEWEGRERSKTTT